MTQDAEIEKNRPRAPKTVSLNRSGVDSGAKAGRCGVEQVGKMYMYVARELFESFRFFVGMRRWHACASEWSAKGRRQW